MSNVNQGGMPLAEARRSAGGVSHAMEFILVGLTCVASIAVFFRLQLSNRFDITFGDRTDGLIQVSLLEHWWNVLCGRAAWDTGFFFYPVSGSMGYNDGYLIYGLMHSVFRSAGLDPIISAEFTNVVLKLVGFCSIYVLLSRLLTMEKPIACLGAVLFTLCNASYANAYHAQLFSVALTPLLAIVLVRATLACRPGERNGLILWGGLSAVLIAAWSLTAFYTMWFSMYFIAGFAIALVLFHGRSALWTVGGRVQSQWPALSLVVACQAVLLVPFLRLYLPKAAETGMHPLAETMAYSPSLLDIANVGSGNLVYGSLQTALSPLFGAELALGGEHVMGMPPLLLLLALAGTILGRASVPTVHRRIWDAMAATALVTWLFTVHVGDYSLWPFFYRYVPGAKAVRAISRYEMVLAVPVTLLAMLALHSLAGAVRLARPVRLGAVSALGLCLTLEQVNTNGPLGLQRRLEMDRVASIPPAPAGCRAFHAVNARPGPKLEPPDIDGAYSNNVDAMFIAEVTHIPTVNGMASFYPPGWDLTQYQAPDYLRRVAAYQSAHGVTAACALDLRTLLWSPQG